mmetsp:Transcript_38784/g.69913  ORF Transcript_38784/g.69913 Transcript_38784/m.69913 type:complete len:378 (-) Transcript_38784:131-1264(-)|eukprot:CAMPEP_0201886738 /NCGR_PEP_ID=MMETSP0902-20130614/23004_1 /ASSEMBLY_ACC=CAM_ASM_000551 /TAXON_ID=420261 /ORGANISM="Thalassiosira antarctica, Strain CCMP982" /LENGTH=377 /DNA_ID=CAMNT_0048416427 /DNA_START=116 /DNA_END=1249 /DNA_ORIENTATION=+
MTSSARKDGMPLKDPYQVLGISPTASETVIKKAYRQLALKVHPDKQSGTLTDSQRDALDKQFHDIKDARSFLLDADHAAAKKKYDANLASERVRHAAEEKREGAMSGRRKRMREELSMRERMAKTTATAGAASSSSGGERFDVDRLRREGERLREEYSNREAEVDIARKQRMAVERATEKLEKEDRQVRLKWSRKKVMGGVHTKHSLTGIMKDFGEVEEVEMLGAKGNAALITFANVSSSKPCVGAYRNSETMRATFVGRRKIDDTTKGDNVRETDHVPLSTSQQDQNLEERNLRRAAERERLMRQMESDEAGGDAVGGKIPSRKRTTPSAGDRRGQGGEQKCSFPPMFPVIPENEGLTPFELLEKYEKIIFGKIRQ